MRLYTIEIDEEVFGYLKKHAEPLEDDPNSVLRKLLLNSKSENRELTMKNDNASHKSAMVLPELPTNIPKALEHTLEVIYLVRKSHRTRTEATHFVADHHRVDYQTIIDKYCRQLGLKAYEFDRLLDAHLLHELKSLLIEKYPRHRQVIEQFFKNLQ